ncbi:DUF7552 domain-containing protein [Haloarcula marina]|uniref:DUF7552 domain-containing protein n=1 Tax=Haloarcula marina TaxID=2961574 RepID=UPI0020B672D7|nr:hypothetical protein [Halomicroarcula marina]
MTTRPESTAVDRPEIGPTLVEIRESIEQFASDDGRYYVVCGRTGERPVPVAGRRFESRATARAALEATEQYRCALRRYDPRTPRYDLIVCEAHLPIRKFPATGTRPSIRR